MGLSLPFAPDLYGFKRWRQAEHKVTLTESGNLERNGLLIVHITKQNAGLLIRSYHERVPTVVYCGRTGQYRLHNILEDDFDLDSHNRRRQKGRWTDRRRGTPTR